MSTPPRPGASRQAELMSSANLYRVAIVGAGSLKGKEVAEMLNERNFPAVDVKLLDDDESLGQLEAMGDEVTFIQSVITFHQLVQRQMTSSKSKLLGVRKKLN